MNTVKLLVILILMLGCGTSKKSAKTETIYQEGNKIESSINQFGFDLFKHISKSDQNIFFSPISISSAMAMAYLGTDGNTEKEFQKTLYFGTNSSDFHESIKRNTNKITSQDSINQLRIANSIWVQKDFKLNKDYTEDIKLYYSGNFFPVDFKDDVNRTQAQKEINKWVANETNNKIENIIPDGVLTPQTRTVLTNAVYFLSEWTKPFKEEGNTQKDFYRNGKKSITTTFMNNSQTIPYYEDENIQCIDIPYKGHKFSLLIALTKNKDSSAWYEDNFTHDYFMQVLDSFQLEEVNVSIPKFKMETSYQLIPYLQEMGMHEAFRDKADFSKMRDENDLKITDILHKAFVEVNEKGTEAAASTAVIMSLKAAYISEKKRFVADHPFIFIIRETETNTVLFMGELNEP